MSVTSGGGLEISVVCEPRFEAEAYRRLGGVGVIVRATSLHTAVSHVLAVADGGAGIEILRFFGHGHPGLQRVGVGKDVGHRIAIDTDSGALLGRANLTRLQGRFADRAWIELRGCRVANGQIGRALLLSVAQLLGVDVAGSETLQTTTGDPVEWENSVLWANPAGSFARVPVQKRFGPA